MIKLKHLLPECNECGRDWNHGHDHEAGMAKNELRDMISNASKIDQMVGEGDDLPGWVSAYVSLAADYMHSVAEYLAGESSRMQQPGPGYSEALNEDSSKDPNILDDFKKRVQFLLDFQKGPSDDPLDIIKFKLKRINDAANDYISGKVTDDSLKKEKELNKRAHDFGQKYDDYMDWMTGGGYGEYDEGKKPSAGLTKKQKSAVSKKAHAGKDIGKKGPGFEKVAKAAAKKYGSKEAGQRVAAAAMWKGVKR